MRCTFVSGALLLAFSLAGCGDDERPPVDANPATLTLRFERTAGSRELDAIAEVRDAAGRLLGDAAFLPTFASDRGTLGATASESGIHRAHLVPDGTGRHTLTATLSGTGLTATRTALVMPEVGDAWNQPEPVRGLVNTPGWEDSATITPDGAWLLLEYLPVSLSCLVGGDPEAPACRVVGPVTEPERPRMPGAERVNADGTFVSGCPSVGVPTLPFPVPPMAYYGFARQPDGSFGEPFVVYYDGIDGCLSAFGLQPVGASGDFVYAVDAPDTPDDGPDLFFAHLALGADVVLGRFAVEAGVITLQDHVGTSVGNPGEGAEGNPFGWVGADGTRSVLYDDETDRQDLFVTQGAAWDGASWTPATRLPEPVSVEGEQESQPFLEGETLYFRRGLRILAAPWNGGPMGDSASWGEPAVVLGEDPGAGPGEVLGAGEPTIGSFGGVRELYFVFVTQMEDGTLDLDVGVVAERSSAGGE